MPQKKIYSISQLKKMTKVTRLMKRILNINKKKVTY